MHSVRCSCKIALLSFTQQSSSRRIVMRCCLSSHYYNSLSTEILMFPDIRISYVKYFVQLFNTTYYNLYIHSMQCSRKIALLLSFARLGPSEQIAMNSLSSCCSNTFRNVNENKTVIFYEQSL